MAMYDNYNSRGILSGTDWRSVCIPRQYTMLSYVYDVDASGNFVPNTTERVGFGFGLDDAASTDLRQTIGYANLLSDFSPANGTDGSILTGTQAKGGNHSGDTSIDSLLLGYSAIPVSLRWDNTVAADHTTLNRSVKFGGQNSSLPTSVQSRSEQLIRQVFRNFIVTAIPDGQNPNCGQRLGKVLLSPSATGMNSESMPMVAAASGKDVLQALRERIQYKGCSDPNVNYNRLKCQFGTATVGSVDAQQCVIEKAPGDPALTEKTSVVVDLMLIADVALIHPELGDVTYQYPDGTSETVKSFVGWTPSDRELIARYTNLR